MGVIQMMPKFLGGRPRTDQTPAPGWDKELRAMQAMAEWLHTIPDKEGKYRALSYLMWRLKSGDIRVEDWVESIAEQSTMKVAKEHGFTNSVESES